jgi:hypothetical protein
MALVVVLVVAQVVCQAVRAEVQQQGKEAMVGTVARQVAMTAQGVAAVKARSVAMLLDRVLVLVVQERQAVSVARLPATLAAEAVVAKALVVLAATAVVEPAAEVAVRTAEMEQMLRGAAVEAQVGLPVLAAVAVLAL